RRYGRVSKPAARLSTRSQPFCTDAATRSSISLVRVTHHHPLRVRRGAAAAIAWPRAPAKRSANGAVNSASGRADSAARYAAIQRAVSDTFEISGSGMAHSFPGPCTSTAAVLRRSKHRKVLRGTVIPEGAGCVKRLLSSGFAGFRAPCRQHWVRAGVKTERPQRSEDERS